MSTLRYVHSLHTFGPHESLTDSAVKQLKQNFSPLVSRRLTRMALMIGECLKHASIPTNASVIYATTYSESNCLEKYLASFPTPSPLMFQNSIHPSGMEQVLIARKQAIEEFLCFAGADHILHSALIAACMSEQPEQWLIVAEEKATWLTEEDCASAVDFALALQLNANPDQALAKLEWNPADATAAEQDATTLRPLQFLQQLQARQDLHLSTQSLGSMSLQWL